MTGPSASQAHSTVWRGITAMLLSCGFFAGMDALLKVFSNFYPPFQVSTMRGAASLPFVLLPVILNGRYQELRAVRWKLHLLRGVLAITMLSSFVYALHHLPLADAYSFFLGAPIVVTALSVPFLKEHVDVRRWLAIGVGLIGMLILLRPSGAHLATLGSLAALLATVCYAVSAITIRVLTRTDSTRSMVFWFMVMLTVFGGLLAIPQWVPIRPEHWPWLIGVGVLGALGQHFVTEAFRYAPASVVAPFEYTALLWALTLDWIFWSHGPGVRMLVGAAIIISCGLYLIQRERVAQAQASTAH